MEIKQKIFEFIKNYKSKIIIFGCIFILFATLSILIFNSNKKMQEKPEEEVLSIEIEEPREEEEKIEKEKIVVDIKGYVENPGIYEMDNSSRVHDVIIKAGGLLKNANTEFINLSKEVFNEMVIVVYSNEEIESFDSKDAKEEKECICENTINDACILLNSDISNEQNSSIVNINTSDLELLMTLPGIGESKANAILEYRKEFGKFENIEDLMEVSGIGESVYSKIKDFITTE